MAAIVSVTNGVTAWDEEHVNQYADAFSNILGVTNSAADALGRLVFPRATSAPVSPSTAMAYFETDEGVESSGGRLKIRHAKNGSGAAVWVPYLPLRQMVLSATAASLTTSSTTYVDVTNATLSITTTGGWIRISLISNQTTPADITLTSTTAVTSGAGTIRAVVGATNLTGSSVGALFTSATNNETFYVRLGTWLYQPVAGTYTVKLQALVANASTSMIVGGGILCVEEFGD